MIGWGPARPRKATGDRHREQPPSQPGQWFRITGPGAEIRDGRFGPSLRECRFKDQEAGTSTTGPKKGRIPGPSTDDRAGVVGARDGGGGCPWKGHMMIDYVSTAKGVTREGWDEAVSSSHEVRQVFDAFDAIIFLCNKLQEINFLVEDVSCCFANILHELSAGISRLLTIPYRPSLEPSEPMLRTLPVLLLVANAGFAAAFAPASSILKAPRSFKAQGVNTVPTRQAPSVLKVRAAASMPMAPALVPEGVPLEQVRAVEKEFRQNQGEEDVKHMKKMLTWSYALYAIGLATAGFAVLPWNPISALCLSTAICVRWTMIGHHVCHGGYSAQVGVDNRFHRSKFARGPIRRFIDWCDWMLPEAWDVEHNYMHHYELGEGSDPDLLERNSHSIRVSKQPKFLKYIQMFALMVFYLFSLNILFVDGTPIVQVMWKWFYYAPNTLKEMYGRQKILASNRGDNSVVQPFELSKAPGDFGDVSKAATIKYVLDVL
eukprot:759651-Hanusia_phi.AAC.3